MKLRVVGDVHGDVRGFAAALATDRFVIQLGDLIDHGPDSVATLTMALDLAESGRGMFLLGNHDWKLYQALTGQARTIRPTLRDTLERLPAGLAERARARLPNTPAWLRLGDRLFVHAGFHTAMLVQPPPMPLVKPDGIVSRALYGQPTGRTQTDGYPERSLAWLDRIPAGITLYCGHDQRARDGRPPRLHGRQGGSALFLDTGAGKGGHLSWIDLD